MDLKEFQNQLLNKAVESGFKDAEIYFQSDKTFEVSVFQQEIEEYKNSVTNGISFRGTYKNRMGYAFSERIDESAIDFIIKEAKQNAEIIEPSEGEELFAGCSNYIDVEGFSDDLKTISIKEIIQTAKNMEKIALEYDSKIKSVNYSIVTYEENEISIQNTKGLDLYYRENYSQALAAVIAQENEQTKTGSELWIGNEWYDIDIGNLGAIAAKKAISYLGAEAVMSGTYPILLKNNAAVDLFQTFAGIFFADNVQKGFSLLKDKLNQKIASEVITIRDYPTWKDSVFKMPFDSEGVSTQYKIVVENGILKTYLHNTKTAKKDNVSPTGNGFKSNYNSKINVSGTNFFIAPKSSPCLDDTYLDGMIKAITSGLMITELDGLHSGTNNISGDFSLSANGYKIEAGKIVKAVEQITIAGNFFDLLNNVENVGEDLKFNPPSAVGVIGSPSLYIKALAVSGL